MRSLTILLLAWLHGVASGQGVPPGGGPSTTSTPAGREMNLRTTVPQPVGGAFVRPSPRFSGVASQVKQPSDLWQLINPFAPARYGNGEANLARDPLSGRADGVKVWQVNF